MYAMLCVALQCYNGAMMASWIGQTFCNTGPLWDHQWVPFTKGQWFGALMFLLMSACKNCWTNSWEAWIKMSRCSFDISVMNDPTVSNLHVNLSTYPPMGFLTRFRWPFKCKLGCRGETQASTFEKILQNSACIKYKDSYANVWKDLEGMESYLLNSLKLSLKHGNTCWMVWTAWRHVLQGLREFVWLEILDTMLIQRYTFWWIWAVHIWYQFTDWSACSPVTPFSYMNFNPNMDK